MKLNVLNIIILLVLLLTIPNNHGVNYLHNVCCHKIKYRKYNKQINYFPSGEDIFYKFNKHKKCNKIKLTCSCYDNEKDCTKSKDPNHTFSFILPKFDYGCYPIKFFCGRINIVTFQLYHTNQLPYLYQTPFCSTEKLLLGNCGSYEDINTKERIGCSVSQCINDLVDSVGDCKNVSKPIKYVSLNDEKSDISNEN